MHVCVCVCVCVATAHHRKAGCDTARAFTCALLLANNSPPLGPKTALFLGTSCLLCYKAAFVCAPLACHRVLSRGTSCYVYRAHTAVSRHTALSRHLLLAMVTKLTQQTTHWHNEAFHSFWRCTKEQALASCTAPSWYEDRQAASCVMYGTV